MSERQESGKKPWVDPDDAPPLTRADFQRGAIYDGGELVRPGYPIADPEAFAFSRPGRPRKPDAKIAISLRVDPDVLAAFRAMGDGWQTQMNAVLKAYLRNDPRKRIRRGVKVAKARVALKAARVGSARRGRGGG
jgi:BrnA antitoxin of type II toxin-antitoxin system